MMIWFRMEEAFNTLGFYVPILAFKILIMSPITSSARYREGSLRSPEDAKFRLGTTEAAKVKLALEDNSEVERIRRAHRNDLEAVVNFILVMIFFIVSGAEATTVKKTMLMYTGILVFNVLHLRSTLVARCLHTLFYIKATPQPSRALCNMVCSLTHYTVLFISLKRFLFD